MSRPLIASALLFVLAMALGFGGLLGIRHVWVARARSRMDMLEAAWEEYKDNHWQPATGRTMDRTITTSEGQSYTMLRAVWQNDRAAFDKTWEWTRERLQHRSNYLFAWLYGIRADLTEGVLIDRHGDSSASDADCDIALALILAYGRWDDTTYLEQARNIVRDIWKYEVRPVAGRPHLLADDQGAKGNTEFLEINPSYLAPYTYRCFSRLDSEHDWLAVVDTSYDLLNRSLSSPLGGNASVGLPPDWVRIDRNTGELSPSAVPGRTANYGWEAMRIPWRLAVDWKWNRDERARRLLQRMAFLSRQWAEGGLLRATYRHDGSVNDPYESLAAYGCGLAYFLVADPERAEQVWRTKLAPLYERGRTFSLRYYDDNWVWFALALRADLVRGYPRALPSSAGNW